MLVYYWQFKDLWPEKLNWRLPHQHCSKAVSLYWWKYWKYWKYLLKACLVRLLLICQENGIMIAHYMQAPSSHECQCLDHLYSLDLKQYCETVCRKLWWCAFEYWDQSKVTHANYFLILWVLILKYMFLLKSSTVMLKKC